MRVWYPAGGDEFASVETSIRRLPTWHYVQHLMWRATTRTTRVRFPLSLTVTREDRQLLVDGEPRTFSVYNCRRSAIAVGSVDGRYVIVDCRSADLRRLTLTRLDEKTVALLVRRARRERP